MPTKIPSARVSLDDISVFRNLVIDELERLYVQLQRSRYDGQNFADMEARIEEHKSILNRLGRL